MAEGNEQKFDHETLGEKRKFIISTYGKNYKIKVFLSLRAMDLNKAITSKKVKTCDLKKNVGVPVITSNDNVFGRNELSLNKCFVPIGGDFDPEIDEPQFCEVTKEQHSSYKTFKFQFTPEGKSAFTVALFAHRRIPILDFEYKNNRYRWIRKRAKFSHSYSYDLYKLSEKDPSLLDGSNRQTFELDNENELVGYSLILGLKSKLPQSERNAKDYLGQLKSQKSTSSVRKTAVFSFIDSSFKTTDDPEDINSVGLDSSVFLCLATYLKYFEDEREKSDSSSYHSGENGGVNVIA
ncbi:uncharacterized protein PRCAT00003609001 [Priceomyces carsonii]|uniref:uncharacterized protein n=1 Tax=Priceomyces carsonii TaxID=28549 RepID=UPI002ED9A115|nr:unnamed protein product [Priceomyces carsonii]